MQFYFINNNKDDSEELMLNSLFPESDKSSSQTHNPSISVTKQSSPLANFIQRMVLVGIGSTLTIVTFDFEWKYHLIMRSIFCIFIILMSIEIHQMLPIDRRPRHILISICSAMIFPLHSMISTYFPSPSLSIISPLTLIVALILFHSIIIITNTWENLISEVSASLFLVIYPGLLSSYWLEIAHFDYARLHYYALLATVFFNDGFAYLIGISLGRKEQETRKKPMLSVSPSKTYTGYIGGTICGMIVYVVSYYTQPSLFNDSLGKALLFGAIINLVTIFGDLFESVLKRKHNMKDSGKLMLGRGGVLDTFDSLLLAAPVYVILYKLFF